jgi:hypothetical protein
MVTTTEQKDSVGAEKKSWTVEKEKSAEFKN